MNVVLVASGKGGVGKSTVSLLLAQHISKRSRTLLLDMDLCGPSIGCMTETEEKSLGESAADISPVQISPGLHALSISTVIPRSSAVIWRAPKKNAVLEVFSRCADASAYDFVVADMPPGITDEHFFAVRRFREAQVLLVTTSQNMALQEASATLDFFQEHGLRILGVIENMRSFRCPGCGSCTHVFSKNGGELLAKDKGVEYIGHLDLVPGLGTDHLETSVIETLAARIRKDNMG